MIWNRLNIRKAKRWSEGLEEADGGDLGRDRKILVEDFMATLREGKSSQVRQWVINIRTGSPNSVWHDFLLFFYLCWSWELKNEKFYSTLVLRKERSFLYPAQEVRHHSDRCKESCGELRSSWEKWGLCSNLAKRKKIYSRVEES